MKTKLKIILVVTLVATLLCSLAIFPSAEDGIIAVPDTVIPAGTYTFNETLTTPPGTAEESFSFYVKEYEYEGMTLSAYNAVVELYYNDVGDYMDVYRSLYGWSGGDAYYRTIIIPEDYTPNTDWFTSWFIENTTPPADEPTGDNFSLYDGFYDLIVEYVYGNPTELDTAQHLVTTFFSTIGSVTIVAFPFLVIIWIFKLILSMIARI